MLEDFQMCAVEFYFSPPVSHDQAAFGFHSFLLVKDQ